MASGRNDSAAAIGLDGSAPVLQTERPTQIVDASDQLQPSPASIFLQHPKAANQEGGIWTMGRRNGVGNPDRQAAPLSACPMAGSRACRASIDLMIQLGSAQGELVAQTGTQIPVRSWRAVRSSSIKASPCLSSCSFAGLKSDMRLPREGSLPGWISLSPLQ